MLAKGVTPILNVSNIQESFAWFEKLGNCRRDARSRSFAAYSGFLSASAGGSTRLKHNAGMREPSSSSHNTASGLYILTFSSAYNCSISA